MGSLSRQRGANRVRDAVQQRINNGDESEAIVWELVEQLESNAFDSEALNTVAYELATTPEDIEFPEDDWKPRYE